MSHGIPKNLGCLIALQAIATGSSAVSPEAEMVRMAASDIVRCAERSEVLFGKKAKAISRLNALANECLSEDSMAILPNAVSTAEKFLRALPDDLSAPEFSIEPDGAISLDWIESRTRLFSLSVGANNRIAFAWLDGTSSGYGVVNFDGKRIPECLIEGISPVSKNSNASFGTT